MFKKLLLFAIILSAVSLVSAQETELAVSSNLTAVSLPKDAQRVLPGSVPSEIAQTLKQLVAAGNGKVRQGDSEVLVWAGANYNKATAPTIIYRLTDTLKIDGWKYSVGGTESGITVFSVLKERTNPRAVIGFYGATDDALVFAWTEVLAAAGAGNTIENNQLERTVEQSPVSHSANAGGIVGIWRTGGMSMMGDRNTVTGATTPSNGSTMKYVFSADGRFEFIGLLQSTVYGCTTSLFNDKRGKYEINGSSLTLIPNKNFWRNTYSCSPNSNKERDYVLESETFTFRTKTDEYGKTFICLTNAKGETCYRREDK